MKTRGDRVARDVTRRSGFNQERMSQHLGTVADVHHIPGDAGQGWTRNGGRDWTRVQVAWDSDPLSPRWYFPDELTQTAPVGQEAPGQ